MTVATRLVPKIIFVLSASLLLLCGVGGVKSVAAEIQLSCKTVYSFENFRLSNMERGASGTYRKIVEISIMDNNATTLESYLDLGTNGSSRETTRYIVQINSRFYSFSIPSGRVSPGFTFYVDRNSGMFYRQSDFITGEWSFKSREQGECTKAKANPKL